MMADILNMSAEERTKVLSLPQNRKLVLSFGISLLLISDDQTSLENTKIGLIYRKQSQKNIPDGIGPLGGIAEIITKENFLQLDVAEKNKLIGLKDNVTKNKNGKIILIKNKKLILSNNIAREVKEELNDIGVKPPDLDFSKIKLINMPKIKDDSYIINVWNGQKPITEVFAINPKCAKLYLEESILDNIIKNIKKPKKYGEVITFFKMPLIDALYRYGKMGGSFQDKYGFDMTYNFRYPHEYLVLWQEAAEKLNYNQKNIEKLILKIKPNFDLICSKLNININYIKKYILSKNNYLYP